MIVSLRCDCAFFLEKLEIIMCRLWRPECVARHYICKVAMEDERKDYLKALSRQCKRETLFCDMDDYTVNLFSSEDTYPSYFHTFEMDGFTVRIENSLLAEALENLDGKKRDVILRYYFLGFDDTEISKILEVNRSTIQRRRHAGLEFIKKFMEEEA